jgi:hypothetical protein
MEFSPAARKRSTCRWSKLQQRQFIYSWSFFCGHLQQNIAAARSFLLQPGEFPMVVGENSEQRRILIWTPTFDSI